MTRPQTGDKELAAAKNCIDAYGGDIERWPEDARNAYGALAMSDALASEREAALALDAFLDAATAPKTADDLQRRILADYRPPADRTGWLGAISASLYGLGGFLRPAPVGAFASLAIAGFIAGAVTDGGALDPEIEAYAYLETDGFAEAADNEEFPWGAD